jgi:hypothetical protein
MTRATAPPVVGGPGEFYVEGSEVNLFLDTENLNATGDVKTRWSASRAGPEVRAGLAFRGREPIHGSADHLEYSKDTAKRRTPARRRPRAASAGQHSHSSRTNWCSKKPRTSFRARAMWTPASR